MKTALIMVWAVFTGSAWAATVDQSRSVFTWTGTKVTGSFHTGNLTPLSSEIDVVDGKLKGGTVVLVLSLQARAVPVHVCSWRRGRSLLLT